MKINLDGRTVWLNTHHLYCFHVIATEGSLSAASKALDIGQSALSIQMKQFESSLGTTLFEREHRKIRINEHGRILLRYSSEIFRLAGEMVNALHDRQDEARINVRIGALDSIPKHLTVRMVEELASHRKTTVSLLEGGSSQLMADLLEHRLDLMVSNAVPTVKPGTIFTRRIARLPIHVYGTSKALGLRRNFPQSLDKQSFVIPTSASRIRQEFESFFQTHNLRATVLAETQDIIVQKLLALDGMGLTVMPEFAVREYLKQKRLHWIGTLANVHEELFLISAARKIQNPGAAWLMQKFKMPA